MDDKKFLLGDLLEDFEKNFSNDLTITTPKSWKDYYSPISFFPKEMSESWLIKKYLMQYKSMRDTFFEDEMPYLLPSIRTLLKANHIEEGLEWNQNTFNKEMAKIGLPLHIKYAPERLRRKFIKLDHLLKKNFGLKLFFFLEKETKKYDRGATAVLNFTLKPSNTTYFSDNNTYSITDIFCLQDDAFFTSICERGFRYKSYSGIADCIIFIEKYNRKTEGRIFSLREIIAIFYGLHPQLKKLISYTDKNWDNSKVLIVKETSEGILESERLPYFRMIRSNFLQDKDFTHTAYIFSEEEKQKFGINLLIKWTETNSPSLTRKEAVSIAEKLEKIR